MAQISAPAFKQFSIFISQSPFVRSSGQFLPFLLDAREWIVNLPALRDFGYHAAAWSGNCTPDTKSFGSMHGGAFSNQKCGRLEIFSGMGRGNGAAEPGSED
jgi:hypothetical protein